MGRSRQAYELTDSKVSDVHRALVEGRALAPLALGGEEEQAWRDCDLASLAENRLGDPTDPRELDAARRVDWERRAASESIMAPSDRDYERCFWLLDGDERAGTIALATSTLGSKSVRVSSFYTYPSHRRRGIGISSLRRIQHELAAHELGLRLETCWSWQHAVRWYLRAGLWVRMWKRDLELCWRPGDPAPSVDLDARHARLSVLLDGTAIVLAEAERDGERLVMSDRPPQVDERLADLAWNGSSTLALGLALSGWPLIRSRDEWERCYWADAGPPEALAYKITTWEAWDKHHGWRVETPRIPGLEYPTWTELEARWEARRARASAAPGST